MTKERTAIIQMLVCSTLWSIAGIFIKMIDWNPFAIAGWRSFFSFLTVLIFMKFIKIKFRLTKRAVANGAFMCMTFMAFVAANKLTTSANAIVLQFTAPIFLLVYSAVFLKQKFHKSDVITVFLTLFGIALFFFDKLESGYLLGNFIAILAGAVMGAMYLLVGSGDETDKVSGMLLGHLFTAIIGAPFILLGNCVITQKTIICIIILGVIQLGIPYILFVLASRACPPLALSLLGAVEPLLNPVWVLIFDGEHPGFFALIGGIIVIATITIWCVYKDKHPVTA